MHETNRKQHSMRKKSEDKHSSLTKLQPRGAKKLGNNSSHLTSRQAAKARTASNCHGQYCVCVCVCVFFLIYSIGNPKASTKNLAGQQTETNELTSTTTRQQGSCKAASFATLVAKRLVRDREREWTCSSPQAGTQASGSQQLQDNK